MFSVVLALSIFPFASWWAMAVGSPFIHWVPSAVRISASVVMLLWMLTGVSAVTLGAAFCVARIPVGRPVLLAGLGGIPLVPIALFLGGGAFDVHMEPEELYLPAIYHWSLCAGLGIYLSIPSVRRQFVPPRLAVASPPSSPAPPAENAPAARPFELLRLPRIVGVAAVLADVFSSLDTVHTGVSGLILFHQAGFLDAMGKDPSFPTYIDAFMLTRGTPTPADQLGIIAGAFALMLVGVGVFAAALAFALRGRRHRFHSLRRDRSNHVFHRLEELLAGQIGQRSALRLVMGGPQCDTLSISGHVKNGALQLPQAWIAHLSRREPTTEMRTALGHELVHLRQNGVLFGLLLPAALLIVVAGLVFRNLSAPFVILYGIVTGTPENIPWVIFRLAGRGLILLGVLQAFQMREIEADRGAAVLSPEAASTHFAALFSGRHTRVRRSIAHPAEAERKAALMFFPQEPPLRTPMIALLGWACGELMGSVVPLLETWLFADVLEGTRIGVLSVVLLAVPVVLVAVWSPIESGSKSLRSRAWQWFLVWLAWSAGCLVVADSPNAGWLQLVAAFPLAYLPARVLVLHATRCGATHRVDRLSGWLMAVQGLCVTLVTLVSLLACAFLASEGMLARAAAAAIAPVALWLILTLVWRKTENRAARAVVAGLLLTGVVTGHFLFLDHAEGSHGDEIAALRDMEPLDDRLERLSHLADDRSAAHHLLVIRLTRLGMRRLKAPPGEMRAACIGSFLALVQMKSQMLPALTNRAGDICSIRETETEPDTGASERD